MKILRGGGAMKIFSHPKGHSENIVGLGEGLRNLYYQRGGGSKKIEG